MSFRFHLCGSSREVIQSCTARDIHDARLILNPREDLHQFVISASSYALGFSKPLAPNVCRGCGLRERMGRHADCRRCFNLRVQSEREAGRKPRGRKGKATRAEVHAARVASGRKGGKATRSPEALARFTQAMRAHFARKKADKQLAQGA